MAQPLIGQHKAGQMRVDQPTPIPTDQVLVGILEKNIDDYVSIVMGTPPPEGENPEFFLTQQIPVDWAHVQRTYAKDRTLEDTYNYSISYDGEDNSKPIYTRDYIVRRALYIPNAYPFVKGQPLKGIYAAHVTGGGSGYKQATTTAVISGGTGSGGAVQVVVSNGVVTHLVVVAHGNYTVTPSITINGEGSGAGGKVSIQPQDAYLIKEDMIRTPESPLDGMYVLVRRVYHTLPGAILRTHSLDENVRGEVVVTTIQKGMDGTLPPETGGLVIGSETRDLSTVVEERTSKTVAGLPDDESWGFWDFVSLPSLIFDITHTVYCNHSKFFSVITRYDSGGGASFLRKHRVTISYHETYPNDDLSGSAYESNDVRYTGKVISFAFNNVLNDALAYSEDFYNSDSDSACFWTESYTFAATTPTATAFAAGLWVTKSYAVSQWGTQGYKATHVEYYSAPGNPSI